MIVRAVTLGMTLEWPPDLASLERAGYVLQELVRGLTDAGHQVQTTRLALAPYYEHMPVPQVSALPRAAQEIESAAHAAGVGYVSLGPVRWRTLGEPVARAFAEALPGAISATSGAFFSIEIADDAGISFQAVRASARVIAEVGGATEDGFGNLRFSAIANCPPGIPFFPAGFHEGADWTVSLALQTADVVASAVAGDDALENGLARASSAIVSLEHDLERIVRGRAEARGVRYLGVDRSPAPFPSEEASAAGMLERLGVGRFGEPGTLAAATLMTRAIREGGAGIGFSGLMLPLLEDSGLAERAGEGLYSWSELLLYSAVCGTGLDTVPLPEDVTEDELAGIILDVAALSSALRKPLTCRLFPVPGKSAGERTEFTFPYFANSVVLSTKGGGPTTLLRRGLLGQRE